MARNISPFAALTSEEKQIKWMEYQSIRLPYTQVDQGLQHTPSQNDTVCEKGNDDITPVRSNEPPSANCNVSTHQHTRPLPPPEVYMKSGDPKQQKVPDHIKLAPSAYQQINEFQRSHHRQYAAVIERMKQAEKKTGCFSAWTKGV